MYVVYEVTSGGYRDFKIKIFPIHSPVWNNWNYRASFDSVRDYQHRLSQQSLKFEFKIWINLNLNLILSSTWWCMPFVLIICQGLTFKQLGDLVGTFWHWQIMLPYFINKNSSVIKRFSFKQMDLQEPGMRAYKAKQINKDSNKFHEATILPRSK